jgi:hypothetical protein
VTIRRRAFNWVWHDDIDANNLVELWPKTDSWAAWIAEGAWDIIGDKIWNTEFSVKVHWRDSKIEEQRLGVSCKPKCASSCKR